MRYLGIDYGDSHIGIAIGDDETNMAVPLETISNEGFGTFSSYIISLIPREGVGAIVVGVPAMGQHYGEQRAIIEAVITKLKESLSVPVHAADESFSSMQAKRLLHETGKRVVDDHAVAAMLILQGYLDRLRDVRLV